MGRAGSCDSAACSLARASVRVAPRAMTFAIMGS